MLACSLARTAFASDSARPSSASMPPTPGRPIVTSSVVSTSPVSVLASSRTVHRIRPALVVRPQPGQSARDRQAACPRFLTLPFGSPNAYLAHRVIPGIEERTGARFRYVPVLLGGVFKATGNRSPAEAFRDVPSKRAFMELETRRFLARHGITDFRWNPHFPVNTLTLMRGAVAAQHE